MKTRILWAIPMTAIALAACFFVAGNLDPLSWSEEGRFTTVLVAFLVFGMTVTCPFIVESRT